MATYIRQLTILLILLLLSAGSRAVDEHRLWLPKKYRSARPMLMTVAEDAESTRRCQQVVAGKMLPAKNTDEDYFFVITCRDDTRRTYTISYRYPVSGGEPTLVAEQGGRSPLGNIAVAVESNDITAEQATAICKTDFSRASDALDDVVIEADQLPVATPRGDGFYLTLPVTAQSELGNRVDYRANCYVDKTGESRFEWVLQVQGAQTICRDNLRAESILLGRATLITDEITQQTRDSGFYFRMPFDVKTLTSEAVRYLAECRVNWEGESELSMSLQPEGAFSLCRDALRVETFLMKAVSISGQPVNIDKTTSGFAVDMTFDANDPEGNLRRFLAYCQVNQAGEAVVQTELDKSAIIAVCTNGVKDAARRMLDVKIREDVIPPLQEDEQGYLAIIPFDAKDPGGTLLNFQGLCRVDESGRTQVDIKARPGD